MYCEIILEELAARQEKKAKFESFDEYMSELKKKVSDATAELEDLSNKWNDKVDVITAKYSLLEAKVEEVETVLGKIKSDIYVDDKEEYDLDITCPYCDAEFSIDMSDEMQEEITCPACNNTIELDWNDDECEHDCSGCHHDCDHDHEHKHDDEDEDM